MSMAGFTPMVPGQAAVKSLFLAHIEFLPIEYMRSIITISVCITLKCNR